MKRFKNLFEEKIRFNNWPELGFEICYQLETKIIRERWELETQISGSNLSESTYLNLSFFDEKEEDWLQYKIRYSNHPDRYGSDVTISYEDVAPGVYDEGTYLYTEISKEALNELVDKGYKYAKEWYNQVMKDVK